MTFKSRKGAQGTEPKITRPTLPDWPPRCVGRRAAPPNPSTGYEGGGCDFVGEANNDQSPYLACGGDPARHVRP